LAESKRELIPDLLRLLAMACIAGEHLATIHSGESAWVGRVNSGRLGVALFCAVSGYFVLRPSDDSAWRWLARRLSRIMPSYWVALSGVLLLNAATRYKPTTLGVVVLEYLGLAGFVPGDDRIGQPFWFITLILICYLIAAAVRQRLSLIVAAGIAAALVGHFTADEVEWYAVFVMTFLACGVIAAGVRRWDWIVLGLLAGVALTPSGRMLVYPLIGVACVMISARAPAAVSPAWLASLSERTFEFFLVHGTVYLGLARVGQLSLLQNAVVGTLAGVLAAYALYAATPWILGVASLRRGT